MITDKRTYELKLKTADRLLEAQLDNVVHLTKRPLVGDTRKALEDRRQRRLANVGRKLGRETVISLLETTVRNVMDEDKAVRASRGLLVGLTGSERPTFRSVAVVGTRALHAVNTRLASPHLGTAMKRPFDVINLQPPSGALKARYTDSTLRAVEAIELAADTKSALQLHSSLAWRNAIEEFSPLVERVTTAVKAFPSDTRRSRRTLENAGEYLAGSRMAAEELADVAWDLGALKAIDGALDALSHFEALGELETSVASVEMVTRVRTMEGPAIREMARSL